LEHFTPEFFRFGGGFFVIRYGFCTSQAQIVQFGWEATNKKICNFEKKSVSCNHKNKILTLKNGLPIEKILLFEHLLK